MADNINNGPGLDSNDTDKKTWALEITQEKILKLLEKAKKDRNDSSKTQSKINKNIETVTSFTETILFYQTRSSNSLDNIVKILTNSHKSDIKYNKQANETFSEFSEQQVDSSNGFDISKMAAIDDLFGSMNSLDVIVDDLAISFGEMKIPSVTGGFNMLSGGIGKLSKSMPKLAGPLALVAATLGAVGGIIGNEYEHWQQMAQVGQTFSNDFFQMSRTIYESGLTLDEGTTLIKKYSSLAANIGVKELLGLQKNTRDLTSEFGNFGLSVAQVSDIAIGYAESQIRQGTFESLTAQKRAQATSTYIKNLSVLSQLTGQSIESMDKERRERLASADMIAAREAIRQEFGDQAAANFVKNVELFQAQISHLPQSFQDTIMAQISNQARFHTAVLDDFSATMSSLGMPVQQNTKAFIESAITSKGASKAIATTLLGYKNLTSEQREQISIMQLTNKQVGDLSITSDELNKVYGEEVKTVSDFVNKQKLLLAQYDEEAKNNAKEQQRANAMAKIGKEWRKIMGDLAIKMQGPLTNVFDALVSGFNRLSESGVIDGVAGIAGMLIDVVGSIIDIFIRLAAPIMDLLMPVINALVWALKPVVQIVQLLGAMFSWVIESVKGMFKTLFDTLKKIPIIGPMIEKIGSAAETLKENVAIGGAFVEGMTAGVEQSTEDMQKRRQHGTIDDSAIEKLKAQQAKELENKNVVMKERMELFRNTVQGVTRKQFSTAQLNVERGVAATFDPAVWSKAADTIAKVASGQIETMDQLSTALGEQQKLAIEAMKRTDERSDSMLLVLREIAELNKASLSKHEQTEQHTIELAKSAKRSEPNALNVQSSI